MSRDERNEDTSGDEYRSRDLPYYLPTEVALHDSPEDCWLSYLGGVYDLTELCQFWKDRDESRTILANAGKDTSEWFDEETGEPRRCVDPSTGVKVIRCPRGAFPDVPSSLPTSMWRPLDRCPWWLNEKYKKGHLTKNSRPCRIINVLTGDTSVISVCEEDTIARIQERFFKINARGASYEWKFEGRRINANATLTDNGIPDERDRYLACGLPDDTYIPSLLCYFKDDFTER